MFIRTTTARYDPTREHEVRQWVDQLLIPAVRQTPGFREGSVGLNANEGQAIAITYWDTRDQALTYSSHTPNPEVVYGRMQELGIEVEQVQVFEETSRVSQP